MQNLDLDSETFTNQTSSNINTIQQRLQFILCQVENPYSSYCIENTPHLSSVLYFPAITRVHLFTTPKEKVTSFSS